MNRLLSLIVVACFASGIGCTAGVKKGSPGGSGTGGSSGTGTGGSSGGPPPPPACNGMCTDFPADPMTDGDAPGNAGQIFGDPGSGNASGGPCLVEPQIGTLFPNNWLRPRFRVVAGQGQDLFEIRLHAGNQANDLVVHTTKPIWTMPKEIWTALAAHTRDMPITVSVRGASKSGGAVAKGTSGDVTIAPVGASGTMVYWSTSGTTMGDPNSTDTLLSGFTVGDESVVTVLKVGDAMENVKDQGGQKLDPAKRCIGCHTSTPDGVFISYNDFYPWNVVLASGKPDSVGAVPDFMQIGGYNAITQPWLGISTFSKAHWQDGEHIMIASLGTAQADADPKAQLAWFDLESSDSGTGAALKGKAFDYLTRDGDTRGAAAPFWSHDGTFIVYTSTDSEKSGRLGSGVADLYRVEYGNRAGGKATPIAGAAEAATAEYYPSLSGDDKLVAYNSIPQSAASTTHAPIGTTGASSWDGMYAQPLTEVFVIPSAGGKAMRLEANDPPKCPGFPTSPGINNSWAKWSPQVGSSNGKYYYWLIFSSWRENAHAANGAPIAQLYITGIVQDENGLHSNPAIYLWNQPADISNHTPAWDVFQIPTVK